MDYYRILQARVCGNPENHAHSIPSPYFFRIGSFLVQLCEGHVEPQTEIAWFRLQGAHPEVAYISSHL